MTELEKFIVDQTESDPEFMGELEKRFKEWQLKTDPYKRAAEKVLGLFAEHGLMAGPEWLERVSTAIKDNLPAPPEPDREAGAALVHKMISSLESYSDEEFVDSLLKLWGFVK